MYRAEVVFSFAALGRRLVRRDEPLASAAEFSFAGFQESYPAGGGFGAVISPDPKLKAQVERGVSAERGYEFTLGANPVVGFYDGTNCDLTVPGTVLGDIEINARSVMIPTGEPLIKRGPSIRLKFDEPVSLDTAYRRLSSVRDFVGLVIGYVSRLSEFKVESLAENGYPSNFVVLVPKDRPDQGRARQASIGMSLLNHSTRKHEFREVARNWLARTQDKDRLDSNLRFLRHFGKNTYNEDRLIGAVNMFDLLPPSEKKYSNGKAIKDVAKVIKRKATLIQEEALGPDRLPRLDHVIECAVSGRNHYIHGTSAKVDLRLGRNLTFLTRAMEFVHGARELLACGWDLKGWLNEDQGGAHPFGAFLRDYNDALARLEAASRT